MALPNLAMTFSPFAILTAEEMNDLVENIEALSDGSGLADGAITGAKLDLGLVDNSIHNSTGVTSNNVTSTSFIDILYCTQPTVNHPTGGSFLVIGNVMMQNTYNGVHDWAYRVVMDDTTAFDYPTGGEYTVTASGIYDNYSNSIFAVFTGVAAGTHTFKLQGKVAAGKSAVFNLAATNIAIIPLAG